MEEIVYNSIRFLLIFYKFVYNLIFNEKFDEHDLNRMKYCVKYSNYRMRLIEIIKNVSKGIGEIRKVKSIDELKAGLDAYQNYMEKARELLQTKDESEDEPEDDVIGLVIKVMPIIEERMKALVTNIQKLEAP